MPTANKYDEDGMIIEVKLDSQQEAEAKANLANSDRMKSELHMAATITCMAAAARLQGLAFRKYPVPGDDWEPLKPEEEAEYVRLMAWWRNWEPDKRVRIALSMKDMAEGVEMMARVY